MNSVVSTLKSLNFDLTAFCLELLLFAMLHVVLKEVLYKPLLANKARREAEVELHLAEAERLTGEARHAQTQYETQRQQERHEVMEAHREAVAEATKKAQAVVAEANVQAQQILKSAEAEVAALKVQFEHEFEGRVEKVAEAIAKRVVETSVSANLQAPLLKRWREV